MNLPLVLMGMMFGIGGSVAFWRIRRLDAPALPGWVRVVVMGAAFGVAGVGLLGVVVGLFP